MESGNTVNSKRDSVCHKTGFATVAKQKRLSVWIDIVASLSPMIGAVCVIAARDPAMPGTCLLNAQVLACPLLPPSRPPFSNLQEVATSLLIDVVYRAYSDGTLEARPDRLMDPSKA